VPEDIKPYTLGDYITPPPVPADTPEETVTAMLFGWGKDHNLGLKEHIWTRKRFEDEEYDGAYMNLQGTVFAQSARRIIKYELWRLANAKAQEAERSSARPADAEVQDAGGAQQEARTQPARVP
jgi:hypothetical protein